MSAFTANQLTIREAYETCFRLLRVIQYPYKDSEQILTLSLRQNAPDMKPETHQRIIAAAQTSLNHRDWYSEMEAPM